MSRFQLLPALRTLARVGALALGLGLAGTHAEAGTSILSIGIDSDNNSATGCTVATANGPATGIELVASTVVTTTVTGATVTRLERRLCTGGALGAPLVYDNGGWNVGFALGNGGSAVTETSIPLMLLPPLATLRAVVMASDGAAGQDATAPFTFTLVAPADPAAEVAVPLSPWLLPPLVLAMLALTHWLRRRYPGQSALVVMIVIFTVSGLALAATVFRDGSIGDWAGVAPVVIDPAGDGPANADLLAVYQQQDASNLYLRIDADIRRDLPGNVAPVVDAGTNQTITLPAGASLNGSATDDGLPNPPGALTLTWSRVSGPGTVTFANASLAATSASFSAAGSYVLRLSALDGALTGSADVTITVNTGGGGGGTNQPPVVSAGSNQSITLPAAATLSGTATDDGLPVPPGALNSSWSLVSGPLSGVVFGNPGNPGTTATFAAPGVYVLQLSATDGALSATSTVQITVADGPPVLAPIADRTINLGERLQVLLEGRDGNGNDALTYALTTAPGGATLNPAPLVDWVPTPAQLGTHTFTARVTDSSGNSATATFNVTVVHVNTPPQLAPQASLTMRVGTAFARTLSATDPDAGETLTFTLVSGPGGMSLSGAALNWSTSGRTPGDYAVTVRVTDSAGAFDQKSFTVTLQQSVSPLAVDDNYEVRLGSTLTVPPSGVLGNDLNPSNKVMTAVRRSDPALGTLSAFGTDGSFTLIAPATNPPPPFGVSELWRNDASGQHVNSFPVIGDVNGDGFPDLVLSSQFIGNRAVDGRTGATIWNLDTTGFGDCYWAASTTAAPVLADVDDDGTLEYVGALAGCERDSRVNAAGYAPWDRIFALDTTNGRVKWASPRLSASLGDVLAPGTPPSTEDRFQHVFDGSYFVNPSVTRLAAGAPPTILVRRTIQSGMGIYTPISGPNRSAGCRGLTGLAADDGRACRATILMSGLDGTVQHILTAPNPSNMSQASWDPWRELAPFTLDVDGDGELEIVSGSDVWKRVGGVWTLLWQTHYEPIQTLASDLDGDGMPEIVHFHAFDKTGNPSDASNINYQFNGLVIHDAVTGAEKRRIRLPFYWTAWLTIADADGDGAPDFVINSQGKVMVVATDGRIKWTYDIPPGNIGLVLEARSGNANVQVYDLDGDGIPEVITNSHSGVVVLNGRDGTVKNRYPSAAYHGGYGTGHNVQVVDADNDGHADILATNVSGPDRYSYILLRGAPNNWLPGPKAHHQVNFMHGDISGNGHVEFNTAVPTSFRNPRQLGTVADPRTTQGTSFTYAINDGETESAPATVFVAIKPTNRPPVITSTPPTGLYQRFNPTPPGGLFVNYYQVTAVDPDPGDTLTYSLPVSPAWHTMDATGRIRFEPTCGSYGQPCPWAWTYITVRVTDSQGAYAEQSFMVNLTTTLATVPHVVGMLLPAANAAISTAKLMPVVIAEVADLSPVGTVLAQDPLAGAPNIGQGATVGLTVSTGPQPVAMPFLVGQQLAAANLLLSGMGLSANATTVFSTTIPAGEVMAQSPAFGTLLQPATAPPAALTVSAGGPLPAPIATMVLQPGPGPFARLAGDMQQFRAVATLTDGTSADVTLSAAWSTTDATVASVDTTGLARARLGGTAMIAATLSGRTAQVTLHVSALVPGDGTPPMAAITAPVEGGDVTAPTMIVGTASDANFLRYELAYALAGDDNYIVLAEGTSPVTNGTLGSLDPTLLLNDLYTLRLRVFDRGQNESVATRTVQVRGARKIGMFTLTFQDLNIAAPGVPLTITRTYDSRDKAKGDFGIGWRLGQQTLRLRTNRVLGTGWTRTVSGPVVSVSPLSEHKVVITMPDGSIEEFDMQISPTSNIGSLDSTNVVGFQARPGTLGRLEALTNNSLFIVNAGPEEELVDDYSIDTYNPQLYRYTTTDDTQYEVRPGIGVTKVTDRNGNVVTFGVDGILHSNGTGIRFTRDAKGRITTISDPIGNAQTYAYDGNGDLVQFTNAIGGVTRFTYDAGHNLRDYQGPDGNRAIRNEYDATGRLVSTTDAKGNTVTFTRTPGVSQEIVRNRLGHQLVVDYDANGRIIAETNGLGGVTTSTYDSRDNRLTETDPLGRVTTKTYDARNNVLTRTDVHGNTTTYTYNARGQVLTTTDPEGRITTNTYDARGNLVETRDPDGGVTRQTYDAAGNPATSVDQIGRVSTFAYDGFGNKVSSTDPLGRTTTYTYDANRRETSITDALGRQERIDYDALGRLTSKVDKSGNRTSLTYSLVANGQRIASRTEPGGRTSTFTYDISGNLTGTSYPDGGTETFLFDAENRPLVRTDRNGATTTFEYDSLGRETRKTLPGGAASTRVYDAVGRIVSQTDLRGNTISFTYGPNTETATDALGHVTVQTFDSNSRRIATTDALGRTTTYAYDGAGNMIKATAPDGSFEATVFDAARRKTAVIDRAGRSTQFAYDAAGQLISVTDPAGGVTAYSYDAVGNRITQTDASGRTTTMTYDEAGKLLSRTRPSGRRESFGYDANGNQAIHTDFNGRTATMVYDTANRLLQKNLPGGSVVSYAYTPAGQRQEAGGDRYDYDPRGRMVRETKLSGETISYTYDAAGNKTSVATARGTTTYTYDALNRIATVVDNTGTTSYVYDAVGNQQATSYPNGITATYTYDTLNRLTGVTNTGPGGVVSSYAYTLGPGGVRVQVVESGSAIAPRTVTYAYDTLYRLVQEGIAEPGLPAQAMSYIYDAVGNRTRMVRDGVVTDYTYDIDDRLVAEASGGVSTVATFDNNGNMVSRNVGGVAEAYGYDAENRMITAAMPSGLVSFTYDVDGMRISKTAGGVVTRYLLDKNVKHALVLVESVGASATVYTHGHQLISQVRPDGAVSFYVADGQLSTRQLTDASGLVTDRYTYDAFGRMLASIGTTPNTFLYTGQQLDPNVGFYYLRARYYDHTRGRFVASDPELGSIFDPVSLHRYLYANGSPVMYYDPSGRFIQVAVAIFAAVFVTDVIIGAVTAAVTNVMVKGAPLGFKKASTFVIETVAGGVGGGVSAVPILGPFAAGIITIMRDIFISHYIAKDDIYWNDVNASILINFFIGGVIGVGLQAVSGDVGQSVIAGGGVQNLMRVIGAGIALLTGTTTSGLEEFLKGGFISDTNTPFWCKKHYSPHWSQRIDACKGEFVKFN